MFTKSSNLLNIWVDADACPVVIKEILFRAAKRTETKTILVANQRINVPSSPHIHTIQVCGGLDAADDRIVQELQARDLVITADIPLAGQVVEKGGYALNPRGTLYTITNIKERLAMRNLMEELRGGGLVSSGSPTFNNRDKQAFAAELDKFICRYKLHRL